MKNFYISIVMGIILIAGISYYQQYVEERAKIIIENAENDVEDEWNSLKKLLYAFNDHERVEEIDNEYIGMNTTRDEDLKNLHLKYFKKKLQDLIDASKVKLNNIL